MKGVFMVQKVYRITFRLDPESLEAIEREVAKTGETKSNVIRRAIEEYLTEYQKIKGIVISKQSTDEMGERVTIRIEPDMLEKLNEISSETGKSISELVRDAIRWSLLDVATIQIPKEEVYRLIRKNEDGAQKTLDDYASNLRP